MLRWILVLALFGLAGLILYYQHSQREVAKSSAYQTGYAKAADDQRPATLAADSLRDSLERLSSLRHERDSSYFQMVLLVDSLDSLAAARGAKIDTLNRRMQQATLAQKGSGRPVASKPLQGHAEVLAYYKKRYEALPRDLTPYEQQVSIREIRLETAKKFAISLTELENIRQAGKLTF